MVDFVPDPCAGTNIFQCFTLRDCSLEELIEDLENPLSDISAGFDNTFGLMLDLQVQLNAIDACITAAVTSAFAIAGEPLPTLPIPDPPVDFSSTQDDLTDMVAEVTSIPGQLPLGALDGVFTLEDDGTKITRIISA